MQSGPKRQDLVFGAVVILLSFMAAFGLGTAGKAIQAQTEGLQVSPQVQVIGENVVVAVDFTVDPTTDPIISLSEGVWASSSPCISGSGTSQVTIDDEACGGGTTGVLTAILTTECEEDGIVTVSSDSASTTSPSVALFRCTDDPDATGGIDIDINNTNNNTINISNSNTNTNTNSNSNVNENTNVNNNVNTNENTNTQDQTNHQDQTNTNEQTNNIDSSPKVNIDFD